MKKPLAIFLCMNVIAAGIIINESKYLSNSEKEEMVKYQEYYPVNMLTKRRQELELEKQLNDSIEMKRKEIVEYLGSNEYKKKQKIHELRNKTGLDVIDYKEYTVHLSFYSDLACENSIYGNVTATGEILSPGMVANNFLDFGTNIYMEGYGLKVNKDRGSKKYFNSIEKFDVFIPRNQGESDSQYYKRVNNLGRTTTKGYILEIRK
ncbi:MAG: hypothetical protein ACRC18_06440 [Cetobacterium sp.]